MPTSKSIRSAVVCRIAALALVLISVASHVAYADTVLYVDDDAPLNGNGAGWGTAYRFLQDGLARASTLGGAVEIRIAEGVYRPDRDEGGIVVPGDRDASFHLRPELGVVGGFAGLGHADPDARDPSAFVTLLDGDLLGNDGPHFAGRSDNSWHVVTALGVVPAAACDGLTVRGGSADGTIGPWGRGGALRAESSTVRWSRCTFRDNRATQLGGAVWAYDCQVVLTSCTFAENKSWRHGGAVVAEHGTDLLVSGCQFAANSSVRDGGALHLAHGTGRFFNCVFTGQFGGGDGGVVCSTDDVLAFTNSVFLGNRAAGRGSVAYSDWGSVLGINQCTAAYNGAPSAAAGPDQGLTSVLALSGSIVSGNGGSLTDHFWTGETLVRYSCVEETVPGLGNLEADPLLMPGPVGMWTQACVYDAAANQTLLVDAGATWPVGGLVGDHVQPDGANGAWHLIAANTATAMWVWGDVAGGAVPGTAYDVAGLRLAAGSPCLDASDNTAVPADAADLDGDGDVAERVGLDLALNPRFVDQSQVPDTGVPDPPVYPAVADMGAYESAADCNGDGVPDACNLDCGPAGGACDVPGCGGSDDCQGNAVPDECDIAEGTSLDCQPDGIPDECQLAENDCNANEVPDDCEPDCNGNGVADGCDITAGTSLDCQPDGVPDECQLEGDDCNSNGVPDACDLASGSSDDYDVDGLPDECQDCDGNGVADACDLSCAVGNCVVDPLGCGGALDCQANGVPDSCDIEQGVSADCQPNAVPDECDIAAGTSMDCDLDGEPDECEAWGPTLYLDWDAPGENTGSSWTDAFRDLQTALCVARDPAANVAEIRVAAGFYRPAPGPGDRTASFTLVPGVALRGGYAGAGAPDPDARDVTGTPTILSGDLAGDDQPGFGQVGENCYHVLTAADGPALVTLDGLYVTGGNADGGGAASQGGGLVVLGGAQVHVADCTFAAHQAEVGAAVYAAGGGLAVVDSTITGNRAAAGGAAIYSQSAANYASCYFDHNQAGALRCAGPTVLEDCVWYQNEGAAVWNEVGLEASGCSFFANTGVALLSDADALVQGCEFVQNTAGGIVNTGVLTAADTFIYQTSPFGIQNEGEAAVIDCELRENSGSAMTNLYGALTVSSSLFVDNVAGDGAAVDNWGGAVALSACTFVGNAAGAGGAVRLVDSADVLILACTFAGNQATTEGGALASADSTPVVLNSTFAGNSAGTVGGAICQRGGGAVLGNCSLSCNWATSPQHGGGGGLCGMDGCCVTVANCVLWENGTPAGTGEEAQLYGENAVVTATWSCIDDDQPGDGQVPAGEGNIDRDPGFVRLPDPGPDGQWNGIGDDFGDLHLLAASPCVNAGTAAVGWLPAGDFDGDPRVQQCAVDIGADETPYYRDCNGNGGADACDLLGGVSLDCNGNRVPDECDIAQGDSDDYDDNGVPDECEDCNGNGVADGCDVDCGLGNCAADPGGCGGSADCQANGIPDDCDVASGTSDDYDGDGVPDECEDCNSNGVPDACDVDCGVGDCATHPGGCGGSTDCQGNGSPDECDLAQEISEDYDGNGVPDECEDCNGNGVPDACDLDCGVGDCAVHPGAAGAARTARRMARPMTATSRTARAMTTTATACRTNARTATATAWRTGATSIAGWGVVRRTRAAAAAARIARGTACRTIATSRRA